MPYIGTGGNDTLSTNEQLTQNIYFGLEGDDLLLFGNKTGDPATLFAVYVEGGVGNDVLSGNISGDMLVGGVGDDIAFGNGGDDSLDGGYGDDAMNGYADNDQISGGFGDDNMAGGGGADSLDGGFGDDTLQGGAGVDLLFGGQGFDVVNYGDAGAGVVLDLINPGKSQGDAAGDTFDSIEQYRGSNFGDTILGSNAGDLIVGLNGADSIDGRGGQDNLVGDIGADRLLGGAGDDVIEGGFGDDTIQGGAGADYMFDSEGNDTFRFAATTDSGIKEAKRDQIDGFASGDRIDLAAIDANGGAKGDPGFTIDTGGKFKVGEVRVVAGQDEVVVQLNVKGDAAPEMAITVYNVASLSQADFLL